jgi:hypothetical protein
MTRLRVEQLLTIVFSLATVATAIWPSWVESLTGWLPDGGSGELEWMIVGALALAALTSAAFWRRDVRVARRGYPHSPA